MPGQLVVGGGGDGDDLIAPGVQGGGQALDVASLPCGVPPLVDDDHRHLFPVELIVKLRQLLPALLQLLPVLLLPQGLIQSHLGQGFHGQQGPLPLRLLRCGPAVQGGADLVVQPVRRFQLRPDGMGAVDHLPAGPGCVSGRHKILEGIQCPPIVLVLLPVVFPSPPGRVLVAG